MSRGFLLAKRIHLRTGSVGDFETLQQVCLAVEEGVERYLVQQPVGHDNELSPVRQPCRKFERPVSSKRSSTGATNTV